MKSKKSNKDYNTMKNKLEVEILPSQDQGKRDAFFLQIVAKNYETLIDQLLNQEDFQLSETLLERATQTAHENNNTDLEAIFNDIKQQKTELESYVNNFTTRHDPLKPKQGLQQSINELASILNCYVKLKVNAPDLEKSITDLFEDILCPPHVKTPENSVQINAFYRFLIDHGNLIKQYEAILESGHPVKLGQLVEAQAYGEEILKNVMELNATSGWDMANNYLLLQVMKEPDEAHQYFVSCSGQLTDIKQVNDLKKQCLNEIEAIRKQSWGKNDLETKEFCDFMEKEIQSRANYVGVHANLQQLKLVHAAVTSPELLAVKSAVDRLEQRAHGFWGFFRSGNQKKADTIREAVCQVSLTDRLHIFTDVNNVDCDKVREALASSKVTGVKSFDDVQETIAKFHQIKEANKQQQIDSADNTHDQSISKP